MANTRVHVAQMNCSIFLIVINGALMLAAVNAASSPNEIALEAFLKEQQQQQEAQPWSDTGIYYEPEVNENTNILSVDQELKDLPFKGGDNSELLQQDFNEFANLDDESSFFELSPSIGQTAGLAIDANDRLVLFHRSDREWNKYSFNKDNVFNKTLGPIPNSTIAVVDPKTGQLLETHGANQFYMPHGFTIDSNGSYWLTDVGSHQVIKLDKNFKEVLKLGEKLVPGNDENHFCQPTDIAVAKNGDFFVADGYCNSRIMKFDKDGKFLVSFGKPNSQNPPKNGEFFVPHSLALIEDLNLLCVADRENKRIQCFAAGLNEGAHYHPRAFIPTGTFYTKAENIGVVFSIREKHHFLVGVTTNKNEAGLNKPQVFVMDMNTGRANTFEKGLDNAHALALSEEGDIYISQLNPKQIVKYSISN